MAAVVQLFNLASCTPIRQLERVGAPRTDVDAAPSIRVEQTPCQGVGVYSEIQR